MNRILVSFIVFCALAAPAVQAKDRGGRAAQQPSQGAAAGGGAGRITPTVESFSKEFLRALTEDVKLSEEQQKKIEAVMAKSHEKSKKNWERKSELEIELEQVGKALGSEIRVMYEGIRDLLSFEQRDRFDEIRVQMRGGKKPPPWARPEEQRQKSDHGWGGVGGPVHGMSGGGGTKPSSR